MFEYHAEAEPPQGDFLGSVMAAGSISKHACTHMRERERESERCHQRHHLPLGERRRRRFRRGGW